MVLERERGEILCSVVEASETIGHEEVIFLPSGVSGVSAIEEEFTVPVGNHVLKILECARRDCVA